MVNFTTDFTTDKINELKEERLKSQPIDVSSYVRKQVQTRTLKNGSKRKYEINAAYYLFKWHKESHRVKIAGLSARDSRKIEKQPVNYTEPQLRKWATEKANEVKAELKKGSI